MRVILEVQSGSAGGKKTWLRSGQKVVVGRTEGADYVIPQDGQISSRHFEVECSLQDCLIRDLGSSNGTFLNGQKVEEAVLRSGDRIVAGQTTFVVQIEDVPTLAPSPTPRPDLVTQSPAMTPAATPAATTSPSTTIPSPPPKTTPISVPKPFDAGLADEDPRVRREALYAAAWTRQRWLLEYCRFQAQTPSSDNWDALLLFAILGKPQDLQRILAIGKHAPLGPLRFQLLAAFGHLEVVEILLKTMRGPNPEDAIAAGLAFTKITGIELESEPLTPAEAERAGEHWKKVRGQFAGGTRWRLGIDVSHPLNPELAEQLELESRWDACLGGNYEGTWNGGLIDLETFPHGR
ncbi:MAG: FHA domain-containing protein [Pirellulaceae bacterium]|nr:FHA domain-containing protein [Pirellulaceae bacterium]